MTFEHTRSATIIEKGLAVYIRDPMTEQQIKKEYVDKYPALLPTWVPPVKFKPKCGMGKVARARLREMGRQVRKVPYHFSTVLGAETFRVTGKIQST